ncbi:MAG TPA: metallopeptidase family protein [Motilibacteraceae bacterium]|nr:metallopeptidase family protein [Motilibacteraceae bacterium]
MLSIDAEEFDELVADALDSIPADLARAMRNVVVLVEDEPEPVQLRAHTDEHFDEHAGPYELLGLYEGVPLTERDGWYSGVLPDRITLFRGPLLRRCASREELVAEVRTTVVHEVAHHFGIDDDRLDELGWG